MLPHWPGDHRQAGLAATIHSESPCCLPLHISPVSLNPHPVSVCSPGGTRSCTHTSHEYTCLTRVHTHLTRVHVLRPTQEMAESGVKLQSISWRGHLGRPTASTTPCPPHCGICPGEAAGLSQQGQTCTSGWFVNTKSRHLWCVQKSRTGIHYIHPTHWCMRNVHGTMCAKSVHLLCVRAYLYVCISVSVCTPVCMHVSLCVHVCIYICMCIICKRVFACVCVYIFTVYVLMRVSMCVCICMHVHLCVCVCISEYCVCTCVYMSLCVCIYVCIYRCAYLCMDVSVCTYMFLCVYMHERTSVHLSVCAFVCTHM